MLVLFSLITGNYVHYLREGYIAPIPIAERSNFMVAYNKYLTGSDEDKKLECALAWRYSFVNPSKWECSTAKLVPDPAYIAKAQNKEWAVAFARIENHFFINKGWFASDEWILDNVHAIRDIPGI